MGREASGKGQSLQIALALGLLALACLIAVIAWPPRCSVSSTASIAGVMPVAGCDQR
jgi:hypothetical protein